MMKGREVGIYEAALKLAGLPYFLTNVAVEDITLGLAEKRSRVLKTGNDFQALSDSDVIFGFFRPEILRPLFKPE